MKNETDPVRPADDAARTLARDILAGHTYAALGVIDPESHLPALSRVAYIWQQDTGQILSLISALSSHSTALATNPVCGLLVGSVPDRGDPLTHPRLSLTARAKPCDKATKKTAYLAAYPKAKLYFDFADFHMIEFEIQTAFLNGGFGQAFRLTRNDFLP